MVALWVSLICQVLVLESSQDVLYSRGLGAACECKGVWKLGPYVERVFGYSYDVTWMMAPFAWRKRFQLLLSNDPPQVVSARLVGLPSMSPAPPAL